MKNLPSLCLLIGYAGCYALRNSLHSVQTLRDKKEGGFFCGPTYLISCLAGGCTLFPFSLIFHQNYLCKTKISKNFFNKGKHRSRSATADNCNTAAFAFFKKYAIAFFESRLWRDQTKGGGLCSYWF